MTNQTAEGIKKGFVKTYLPWIVALAAGIVYCLTLNRWLAIKNLQPFARATGEAWFTDVYQPVFTLVTSPFRWVPETWVPVALNLFSVVCAALVLALLARCVALLPQDRTHKQREREQSAFGLLSIPTAWIPSIIAAAVCGLQLTFWENATNSSADILDLLLFAYAVRCFLEFRVSQKDSWLLRGTLIYALGMTESWLFIALAPAFLASLIWMKGLKFFNLQFIARVFLCGVAGLLFYFYLPLLHMMSDHTFWESFKENAGAQMQQVLVVYRYLPHDVQFFLTFTSLLPILVISIRWKSHFGDTSQIGTTLTTWIFHLTNAALLVVCVWATFDTGFSLRDPEGKFPMIASNRDRLLPLYFLSALSIGYLSGYFLLVFRPLPQRLRRPSALQKFLSRLPEAAVWALMFLAPAGLLYKNIPQISVTNGPALCRYAAALTEKLPPHGSVVLSDRPDSLMLAEAWLARSGKSKDFVFLETHSLKFPAYYWFEKAKHPLVWPTLTTNVYREDLFTDRALVYLLTQLSASNSIYYLHPSFGAYFERFYAIPHGLVYELKEYPTNGPVFAPPLADAVLAENENFWKGHEPAFRELLAAVAPPKPTQDPTLRQRFMDRLHIPFERNSGAFRLGVIYSQALNTLGGYEQRMGRLEAAGKHFQAAHEFFPDNVVAAANLDFNTKLRSGERIVAQTPESFEERFGKFSNWESILDVNGLFDDATGCLAQGIVFARGGMKRQPAQQFERVLSLAPDSPLAKLWLARMYVLLQTPDKALTLTSDLKAHSDSLADAAITPADVFTVELSAAYASSQEKATRLLQETISRRSPETNVLDRAAQISIAVHDYTNALAVVDKQLSLNPANSGDRVNRGYIELQLGNFSKSIETLSQVISLEPTNFAALFDRALANMRNGNLDDSRKDYEALLKLNPRSSVVYYGLGEVALQQKNTNAAIGYYQASQSNAPPNSVEFQFVSNRLSSLKNHSP